MKILIGTFVWAVLAALAPAFGEDKSNDILLVHAGTEEIGDTGYSYGSDTTLKYIAEYLWGFLAATEGFGDARVDYVSEGYAHSLADIYYDPMHADLKAQIGAGYRYVILFDSDQAYAYPEILYEGCKQLSDVALEAGSTPMMMLASSDHVGSSTLGEYAYRAANGCGVELIPGTYAMQAAGIQAEQTEENRARQAWIAACSLYRTITGLDPADTGYSPTYDRFSYYYNEFYDSRFHIEPADLVSLTRFANEAVRVHSTNEHYTTSYELDGSVVYRSIDVSAEPFNHTVRYFYKGTSTHEWTGDWLNVLITESQRVSEHKIGAQQFDSRYWTVDDLRLRAGTFADYADEGLFLYVSGSEDGAYAQDIIDTQQANLIPMVFDWIKLFDGHGGAASMISALNNEDCADLWDNYNKRGWKTIPLTVGMGRLHDIMPHLPASSDALHISDPLIYMNASMMIASSMGVLLPIPDTLGTKRGTWTHEDLVTAIETGHDLMKELAHMSETSAYVPDSDLVIVTDMLPELAPDSPYTYPLSAAGGEGAYTWKVISSSGLPDGLSLSRNGVLSGVVTESGGAWNVAFKVTDGAGAFRKVGLKLMSGMPETILRMDMGWARDEMVLSWATDLGATYGVMARTSLVNGVWDTIITNIPGTGSDRSITTFVSEDTLFYRVVLEE